MLFRSGDSDALVRRQAFLALRMLVGDETAEAASALVRAALMNETNDELRAEYQGFLRSLDTGERFP